MPTANANFYAVWRAQSLQASLLREGAGPPPERLLQLVWFHQRLRRAHLRTVDGRVVEVLHPGFWNREAGPDFRDAMVRLGGEAPLRGDVEVDLHSGGWRAHGHVRNPNYRNVVLHVVWQAAPPADLATLAIKELLDAPVDELLLWLGGEEAAGFPDALTGQCCAPLRQMAEDDLADLLRQAALVRLQSKAERLQARARQAGWEPALWEGLLRALGYKHNTWPMERLGELASTLCPGGESVSPLAVEARLLGVAGLLPEDLTRARPGTDQYVRELWDVWWRERDGFAEMALPRAVWRFGGMRPGNHPQRRLALAARWLAAGNLPAQLEQWCAATVPERRLVSSLLEILQVKHDEFWSRHWNLRAAPMARAQPLLGATRVTDLAVNVVLPWLWMRAVEGRNEAVQAEMERRFLAWPPAEDNAVLKLARRRLLGGTKAKAVRGAAGQQGLMQIVRDFCERSNALCGNCQFPSLARDWENHRRAGAATTGVTARV